MWDDSAQTLTAINDLLSTPSSMATCVNDAGIVAGVCWTTGGLTQQLGFVYQAGNATTFQSPAGGDIDTVVGVNASGQVIATYYGDSGYLRAFLWDGTNATDLGDFGDSDESFVWPQGINDAGQVVGTVYTVQEETAHATLPSTAFLWQNGTMNAVDGEEAFTYTVAQAINVNGESIGSYLKPSPTVQNWYVQGGFYAYNGVATDLTDLGGGSTLPSFIDALGSVYGILDAADGSVHLFDWQYGTLLDLGSATLTGGDTNFQMTSVNAWADIGGFVTDASGAIQPFLQTQSTNYNLLALMPSSLGFTATSANGSRLVMNDAELIAAAGTSQGHPVVLLLTQDADGNGLPDGWEVQYFGHTIGAGATALAANSSGLTILQCYQQGIDPNDFYNGQPPTLAIVSGNNQTAPAGGFVTKPLIVSVADNIGNPLVGAPVTFTVAQGGGQLQASSVGAPGLSITVPTNDSGQATAFFQLPNVINNSSRIAVASRTGGQTPSLTFIETSGSTSGGIGVGNPSPFAPTDVVANLNLDGSVDVSWTNDADPTDQTPIDIQYTDVDGNLVTIATVPAGTTSYTIPADASPASAGSGDWPATIDYVTPPAQGYATVDLSGDSTDGNDVSLLALDDNNNAAFAYYTDLTNGPPQILFDPSQFATGNCVVKLWNNGTLSDGQTFSLSSDSSLTYPYFPIPGITPISVDATHFFVPTFITSVGDVYGDAGWWVPSGTIDQSGMGLPFKSSGGPPQTLVGASGNYFVCYGAAQEDPTIGRSASVCFASDGTYAGGSFYDAFIDSNGDPWFRGITSGYPVGYVGATTFDGNDYSGDPWDGEYIPDSDGVMFDLFLPELINKNGWVIGAGEHGYSLWRTDQQQLTDFEIDGYPVAINDNNDVLVGGDTPYLLQQGDPTNRKYFLKNDDAGDDGMLPALAQTEIKSIYPRMMSNRAQPPTGDDVEPALYIIFDAQIRRSVASDDWEQATFLLRLLSDSTIDLQEITGLENLQVVSINANGLIAFIGNSSSNSSTNRLSSHTGNGEPLPTVQVAGVACPIIIGMQVVSDGEGWDPSTNILTSPTVNINAAIAKVAGHDVVLNIFQDINVTLARSYIDGSYAYCVTSTANWGIDGFIADDPTNSPTSAVFKPSTPSAEYNSWFYRDYPQMYMITSAERLWIEKLEFDGKFRDYITASVDSGAPQLVGEVTWSLSMGAEFHAVTVGATNNPTTEDSATVYSTPAAFPSADAKYHLVSPSKPKDTPVSTRKPVANDFANTKKYWYTSNFPAGNNEAKTVIKTFPK